MIEPHLPLGERGPIPDLRRQFNAVMWQFRTGNPWRDLPAAEYGPRSTVYDRFRSWAVSGVFGLLTRRDRLAERVGELSARVNDFLAGAVALVRERFGGRITYAAIPLERVDWACGAAWPKRAGSAGLGGETNLDQQGAGAAAGVGVRPGHAGVSYGAGGLSPLIDQMLRADLDAPPKQWHTARRIFDRLAEEHDANARPFRRSERRGSHRAADLGGGR